MPCQQPPLQERWDHGFQRRIIQILPGEYYATCGQEVLFTVLGSCICACIQETALRIGGMNHFLLPGGTDTTTARYGDVAMNHLIQRISELGGQHQYLEAKIFGGATLAHATTAVGKKNISFVRDYLTKMGIPLVSEDVGGRQPRKVYYIPVTNEVFVKKLGAFEEVDLPRC